MELRFLFQIFYLFQAVLPKQKQLQLPMLEKLLKFLLLQKAVPLPPDAKYVNKFPLRFTDLVICVFDIFTSVPVPFARDFFILTVGLFVSINSSLPRRFECFSLKVKGDLFLIAD